MMKKQRRRNKSRVKYSSTAAGFKSKRLRVRTESLRGAGNTIKHAVILSGLKHKDRNTAAAQLALSAASPLVSVTHTHTHTHTHTLPVQH